MAPKNADVARAHNLLHCVNLILSIECQGIGVDRNAKTDDVDEFLADKNLQYISVSLENIL